MTKQAANREWAHYMGAAAQWREVLMVDGGNDATRLCTRDRALTGMRRALEEAARSRAREG